MADAHDPPDGGIVARRFTGGVNIARRKMPWWQRLPLLRVRFVQREREGRDRHNNAKDLRDARTATGMPLEGLAEASGIDAQRLRDTESAEPQADLTFNEWLRLAVALEGHTWDEYLAIAAKIGDAGWVADSGHRLEGMRRLVRYYFPSDAPNEQDT